MKTWNFTYNAHYRDVFIRIGHLTDKIKKLTDSDISNLFISLRQAFEALNKIAEKIILTIVPPFMFKPTKDTPEEIVQFLYKSRGACYKDTNSFHLIKGIAKSAQASKETSLNQFLHTHPATRHLSREKLKEITVHITLIENLANLALEKVNDVICAIETAREDDVATFVNGI